MDTLTPIKLPIIAIRGIAVLPGTIIHFDLGQLKARAAVEAAMKTNQRIFLTAQKTEGETEPGEENIYIDGTIAVIRQLTKIPGGAIRIMIESLVRAKRGTLQLSEQEYLMAEITEENVASAIDPIQNEAYRREILEIYEKYLTIHPKANKSVLERCKINKNLANVIDQVGMNLPSAYEKKQRILELSGVDSRSQYLMELLNEEIRISEIRNNLAGEVKGKVEKNQKEYILREQLNYIRSELGEDDSLSDEEQFEKELKELDAPQDITDKIAKEIGRFKKLPPSSSENAVERAYIETLLELPWNKMTKDNNNLNHAEKILDEDHYGLDKVKERIMEYLAVRCLTGKGENAILCLVGPPGTGKTSIAKSVARALNKKYIRICLGGVRDEAEIRGHRKTYIGAMPGRIAVGLKQAQVKNPLMLLDEIDKVSNDYKGDTFSALLEVLDSEQNVAFQDHYVELPIDLSSVLFIATANTLDTIPRPLLDRMEVIQIAGYTANEKFHIAKEHLIKKQFEKNGLTKKQLTISDSALRKIIESYVRESGVRNLERKIGDICRKSALEILKSEKEGRISVTASNLPKYLGIPVYVTDKANEKDEAGIVRGLAWTSVGGDTLQIEVNQMPGKGALELTGQMGDVMKESAHIAYSYVKSISKKYKISPDIFKKYDFHLHIPEGAVPKDGPSAGITMATAIFSAITQRAVRADTAMTGEITLRGKVLPVGGLKEKILAAQMAGMKRVLVPAKNKKDIDEIEEEIKSGLDILYVETMEDVIREAVLA